MKPLSKFLAIATLLAAAPAFAGVTFTTRDDATNSMGNPVSASAEFTIVPDGILVKINNTTSNIRNYSQSLEGITFTVFGRRAQGTINFSQAHTRTVTPEGVKSSPNSEEANWQLVTTGSSYTLRAPGRQRHILPDTNDLAYAKGDKTLKDAPESNPFLSGPVTIHILNKDIGLSDDIIGVKFSWGDELGGFDAKLTADSSNGPVNTAGSDGGGGGGGGGLAGTPGDISLAPPSSGESYELGLEGASSGPIDNNGPVSEQSYGGDPGNGNSSNPNRNGQASNQQAGTEQPTFPEFPPQTPALTVPQGASGPNSAPPTGIATDVGPTPTPDAPPAIRIPLPADQFGPNPLPAVSVADDIPIVDNTPPADSLDSGSVSTPLAAPVQSVPEPASLALLGLGVTSLLTRRRKRQ